MRGTQKKSDWLNSTLPYAAATVLIAMLIVAIAAFHELGFLEASKAWDALSTLIGFISLFISGLTLFYLVETAKFARATFGADINPFLSVEMVDEGPYRLVDGKFYSKEEKPCEELWIRIRNAGKSPAIVTGMDRRWYVGEKLPKPIQRASDASRFKSNNLPIGAQSTSSRIRSRLKELYTSPSAGEAIYLYGYILFNGLDGTRYACGYCLIFNDGYFHDAWPLNSSTDGTKPSDLIYQEKICSGGEHGHE